MYKITEIKNRWNICKGGKVVLSGFNSPAEALAVARVHGLILSEYKEINRAA